jgi:hypothetical protein
MVTVDIQPASIITTPPVVPKEQPAAKVTPWENNTGEVCGTITGIFSRGFLFLMTDSENSERVFVPANLYQELERPELSDKMRCRVIRNEQGLRATKVIGIVKRIST